MHVPPVRLPACFWHFGWPGYDSVCRTRNQREGYRRVELCYHRRADAFHTSQSFHRAEWTEGVAISNDALGESGSDVSQCLDFLLAGDVQVHGTGWIWGRVLLPLSLRLPEAGAASGVRRFYLGFEGGAGSGIGWRTAMEGPV